MAFQDHQGDGKSGHKTCRSSCQTCNHCNSHYYLHHMDDRQKHFFKIMVGDFQQEMTIPEKFANNFRDQIFEFVKLEAPDGNIYNVEVSRNLNKMVLRSGWGTFSSAYQLKEGDMLVFRYSGESHLKVLIFDPSGCEKELFRVVKNSGHIVEQSWFKNIAEQRGTPHEQSPTREGLAQHYAGDSSHSRKASKMTPADSPSQRSNVPSSEDILDPVNSGGHQTSTELRCILATGCNLTIAQKAIVDTIEKKIRPEIPLYVTNMNKTNLSDGFLVMSKDYSDKYVSCEDQAITLCHPPEFKKRDANFKVSTDGAYIFSPRWPSFLCDNELQESDVCAFEVSKSERRVTITVHPIKGSYEIPEFGSSSSRHRVAHERYMVTKHTNLSQDQRKKIEEKLREIQCETPPFVFLKRRCSTAMCFSREFAVEHLPRAAQAVQLRRPGMSCSWEAELQVNRVHQLMRGWRQFVDDNALREGDMCLFLPVHGGGEEGELAMNVHVIRRD
ncbi:hypothetical protein ACP70R_032417 [Stipagrostis hirtigluma subsp. patula]